LKQYKGCDILDINPGACLWSTKLHKLLKPRRHILLEPNPEIFHPYLDPLVEVPGSKYKLVAKDPLMLGTYRELIDEGMFPDQTRIDPSDPKAQEINNTLLVTGSLVWDPRLPGHGFDSMAKQIYHHFASSAWSNDTIHALGPVRTLLWVQTEDFNSMIAQASKHMLKSNRLLEMTQDINLVVSTEREERSRGKGAIAREPQYEIESTLRALRSGEKSGVIVPPNRQESTQVYAELAEKASGGSGIIDAKSTFELLHQQHMAGNVPIQYAGQVLLECTELYKNVLSECPDVPSKPMIHDDNFADATTISAHSKGKLMKALNKYQSHVRGVIKAKVRIEQTADIGEEMLKLEMKALKMEPGPQKDSLIEQIEVLDKAWDESLKTVDQNMKTAPLNDLDDRINLRYPPHPRLQWDSRSFEPLMSREDEVWPRTRLSLVLSTPLPKPAGDSEDFHEWAVDFVHGLYQTTAKSLPDALDAMQHSLSEIIKDCPSLTDPDKGGRMQMKHLRVRMLTTEMIYDLVRAYRDWPFKSAGTDTRAYFRNRGLKN
jgi:transcription factor 1